MNPNYLPKTDEEQEALMELLQTIKEFRPSTENLTETEKSLADRMVYLGWVKEFKLLGVGPLLRLTPEGEAEIARYHRVSNNRYDMNRSEKIKC